MQVIRRGLALWTHRQVQGNKYGRDLLIKSPLGFLYAGNCALFYGIKIRLISGDRHVPNWDI